MKKRENQFVDFRMRAKDVDRVVDSGDLCVTMQGEILGLLANDGKWTIQRSTGIMAKAGDKEVMIFEGDKVKGVLKIPEHLAVDGKTEVNMCGIVEYNYDRYLLRTVEEESEQERYAIGATFGFIGDDGSMFTEMEIIK